MVTSGKYRVLGGIGGLACLFILGVVALTQSGQERRGGVDVGSRAADPQNFAPKIQLWNMLHSMTDSMGRYQGGGSQPQQQHGYGGFSSSLAGHSRGKRQASSASDLARAPKPKARSHFTEAEPKSQLQTLFRNGADVKAHGRQKRSTLVSEGAGRHRGGRQLWHSDRAMPMARPFVTGRYFQPRDRFLRTGTSRFLQRPTYRSRHHLMQYPYFTQHHAAASTSPRKTDQGGSSSTIKAWKPQTTMDPKTVTAAPRRLKVFKIKKQVLHALEKPQEFEETIDITLKNEEDPLTKTSATSAAKKTRAPAGKSQGSAKKTQDTAKKTQETAKKTQKTAKKTQETVKKSSQALLGKSSQKVALSAKPGASLKESSKSDKKPVVESSSVSKEPTKSVVGKSMKLKSEPVKKTLAKPTKSYLKKKAALKKDMSESEVYVSKSAKKSTMNSQFVKMKKPFKKSKQLFRKGAEKLTKVRVQLKKQAPETNEILVYTKPSLKKPVTSSSSQGHRQPRVIEFGAKPSADRLKEIREKRGVVLEPREGKREAKGVVLEPREGKREAKGVLLEPREGKRETKGVVLEPREGKRDKHAEHKHSESEINNSGDSDATTHHSALRQRLIQSIRLQQIAQELRLINRDVQMITQKISDDMNKLIVGDTRDKASKESLAADIETSLELLHARYRQHDMVTNFLGRIAHYQYLEANAASESKQKKNRAKRQVKRAERQTNTYEDRFAHALKKKSWAERLKNESMKKERFRRLNNPGKRFRSGSPSTTFKGEEKKYGALHQ